MNKLDLSKALKPYKSGWVAVDTKKEKVIAHAKDFDSINKKVIAKENDIFIMPASEEYFGYIT